MSIAVSAAVRPSRRLIILTTCMCLAGAAIAVATGLGLVGQGLSPPVRFLLAAGSGFLALFGFYHGSAYRKTIHIDISGMGQIRVRHAAPKGACTEAVWPHIEGDEVVHDEVVHLLSASTIWPHMLLLHLRAKSGKIIVLPILPDSVSRRTFRALAVACRWIATQSDVSKGRAF